MATIAQKQKLTADQQKADEVQTPLSLSSEKQKRLFKLTKLE